MLKTYYQKRRRGPKIRRDKDHVDDGNLKEDQNGIEDIMIDP